MLDEQIIALERNNNLAGWGWVACFLFPLAGVVIGIVLMRRNDDRGIKIAVGSLAFGVLWALLVGAL